MERHETQESIAQWCEEVFGPQESNLILIRRAMEEMEELVEWAEVNDNHPKIMEEIADVIIVLCPVMSRLGEHLTAAINRKMAVNRARKWVRRGDGCGDHVKG